MPITSSAKKALRSSKRKRVFNLRHKKDFDVKLHDFRKLVADKNKNEANKMLPEVFQSLDKAAKTGYIKPNTAARLKSRASKAVNKIAK